MQMIGIRQIGYIIFRLWLYIMKDYPYVPGWRQNKENNKPAIKHSVLMFTTHGIVEGEWVGNEWVQYRWSCKVKDTEVLYWMHLEDLTQLKKEGDCFQQEQPNNMIQWTGNNLKEVIDFTGKSPRFGEWFKSWEEYENYVHSHNDILKLFCEDGSHYEVPVGAWIVKTPDGYNVPSVSRFVQEQPEVDLDFQVFAKEMDAVFNLPKEVTENTEENPLNWEYAIARHFYSLGINTRKED